MARNVDPYQVLADADLPAHVAEWLDHVADELRQSEISLDERAARRVAARVVARLFREHGGTNRYVPKGDALERALRDVQMWAEYDGTVDGPNGVDVLARRYGISAVYVYRVLKGQRAACQRQISLPGFDG